jgi:glutaminyl-peptide cyclotransferase
MRRFLLGALQLAAIYPFLACGDYNAGVPHRESVQTTKTAQTTNAADARLPAPPQQDDSTAMDASVPVYTYEVVNSWPHDPKAFTQGLAYHDGYLYESTGHHGSSSLRKVELKTGKVKKKHNVPEQYFAEGMTIFHDKVFQLTWQSRVCFFYDLKSFELLGEFHHGGEGWGITDDDKHLIMSDGTHQLRFLDPNNFLTLRTISVLHNNQPLKDINELEYVKGEIYANIWHSEKIVRIDPTDGHILGWIDLAGLRPPDVPQDTDNVLNGIAYDEKEDRLFVTGKRWTKVFEIRLKRK